jgi:hypothetical protein
MPNVKMGPGQAPASQHLFTFQKLCVIAEFEQAIFGIVALAAAWTCQTAVQPGSLPVVIFRHGKRCTATACTRNIRMSRILAI